MLYGFTGMICVSMMAEVGDNGRPLSGWPRDIWNFICRIIVSSLSQEPCRENMAHLDSSMCPRLVAAKTSVGAVDTYSKERFLVWLFPSVPET